MLIRVTDGVDLHQEPDAAERKAVSSPREGLRQAIHALEETGRPDQLTLRRLKKQKLALKDQIVRIEDQLIPDIIA